MFYHAFLVSDEWTGVQAKVTNGSNHWILCQLTKSTNLIHGQGTKVLFAATCDRLSHHLTKEVEVPQIAVLPLMGLVSVANCNLSLLPNTGYSEQFPSLLLELIVTF